jgi:membrane-associated protease RseP (regulator of RpoE activity)
MNRMVCFGGVGALVLALTASMVFGSTKAVNQTFSRSATSAFSSGSGSESAVSKMGVMKKGKKKPMKKSGKNKKNKKHHRKHHRRHHHHHHREHGRDCGWHDDHHRGWPHFMFSGIPSGVHFVSTPITVVDDEDDGEIEGDFGLIITDLDEDGPAAEAGLDIDDTIISINGVRVQTLEQMNTALKNIKGTVVIVYISDESEEVEEEDITPKAGKIGATLEVVELEDAD